MGKTISASMGLMRRILFICASWTFSSAGAFPSGMAPDYETGVTLPRVASNCQFPDSWTGSWFQSSVGQFAINSSSIGGKMECIERRVEKMTENYHIYDRSQNCLKCMAVTRPDGSVSHGSMIHKNVISYKESYCISVDEESRSFQDLCNDIMGNQPLLFMFRLDTKPEKCPFHGRFKFTYKQGSRECKDPVSYAESCAKDSEFQWQYKSCPDMTEERKTRMECFGHWRDGENHYLLSRIFHSSASTHEETFRCLIFKKTADGFLVAQSTDATCADVYSATQGPQLITMTREPDPDASCVYPKWLTEKQQWQDMAGSHRFTFSEAATTVRQFSNNVTSQRELLMNAICIREEASTVSPYSFKAVAFVSRGCATGYVCLNWRLRSDQIVQLQQGRVSATPELACSETFLPNQTQWSTLVAASPLAVKCPFQGQYIVPTPRVRVSSSRCSVTTQIAIGCHRNSIVQFKPSTESIECLTETEEYKPMYFACHGYWTENGIGYFVASETRNDTKHCFIYEKVGDTIILSSIPHRCPVEPVRSEQYNVTSFSQCSASSGSSSFSFGVSAIILSFVLLWISR